MLGKLVKYDFKAVAKIMVPIYLVLIVLSTVFALLLRIRLDNGIIFTLLSTALSTTMIGSGIATLFCIGSRFNKGLLKNEGYLSFALPVKTSTHILAKLINAVIWSVTEGAALFVSLFLIIVIASSSADLVQMFREIMDFFGLIDRDVILAILHGLSIMVTELIASICLIYAGFAVAHLFDRHKTLIMAGFILTVIVFRSTIVSEVLYNNYLDFMDNQVLWYLQSLIPAALYLVLTWFILDRKLNLE